LLKLEKKKGFTIFPTIFGVKISLHFFFNKKILTIFSLKIFPTIIDVKFSLEFFLKFFSLLFVVFIIWDNLEGGSGGIARPALLTLEVILHFWAGSYHFCMGLPIFSLYDE